jgi:hypothetical protein
MKAAALFLNSTQRETKMWQIADNVSDEERAALNAMMRKYEPETRPGGLWNWWRLEANGDGTFNVSRFTWDRFSFHGTLENIDKQLGDYFKERT